MSNLTPHLTIRRREYCATDLHHHAIAGSGLFVRRPCILSWSMECHRWHGAAQVRTWKGRGRSNLERETSWFGGVPSFVLADGDCYWRSYAACYFTESVDSIL